MDKEEIRKKREEKWIEAWFMIEVMAVDETVAKEALESHVKKLENETPVFEVVYQDSAKVENPTPTVKEAYSKICEVKLFARDVTSLLRLVLMYGPAAIEIMGPKSKDVSMEELQNISNSVAGLMHQFASAGVGGVVISPTKK
ncbi:MAG: hypothetical protein HY365_03875 [Candidatus Aenigmarchaeota archaeon]|nr:hypothetical protein [Candidatus Aenigmarchaeota archaeon]